MSADVVLWIVYAAIPLGACGYAYMIGGEYVVDAMEGGPCKAVGVGDLGAGGLVVHALALGELDKFGIKFHDVVGEYPEIALAD